jgi:putative component of membrane protein insertase Oxa1/YidC/SpoIIIJ protein YidD
MLKYFKLQLSLINRLTKVRNMALVVCLLAIKFQGKCQNVASDSILLSHAVIENRYTVNKQQYRTVIYNIPKQLLYFYKSTISQQLSAHCEFEPSCSTFSDAAIEQFGFLKGFFLTADRLSRCGVSFSETPHYLINRNNAKIIDTPSQYSFAR